MREGLRLAWPEQSPGNDAATLPKPPANELGDSIALVLPLEFFSR